MWWHRRTRAGVELPVNITSGNVTVTILVIAMTLKEQQLEC